MALRKDGQEFDEFNGLMFLGEIPNATYARQRSEESRLNRLTSCDIPGNFKILNNGFRLNHFGGLPKDEVELPTDQQIASVFADWNLEKGPAKMPIAKTEYKGDTLLSAQPQSIACAFNELNGSKTGLQNTENHFIARKLMNEGIGCVSVLPFPVDAQSPLAYSHSGHVNQSRFAQRNIEEEQLCKTLVQRNLLLQLQQNRQFDPQNLIHANSNMVAELINQNQGYYLQSHRVPRLLHQSSFGFPYGDLDSVQVLDKTSQQCCSGKILKTSNGLSTLGAMKLGAVPGNESLNSEAQNGKFIVNGQVCCSLWDSNSGLGSLTPKHGPLSYINGLREAGMELLPQNCGSLDKVRGCIYRLAKDPNGCRYLQQKFSEGSPKEVEIIFHEVLQHIVDLMTDPFGNYFIQKLLEVCNGNQTMQILQVITRRPGNLVRISCDMHGTRAVQKILQILKTPEQFSILMDSLKPGMVILMKNMNGNHVARCCLENLTPKFREFLFEVAAENCIDLATDRYGCCVLQKCLGHPGGKQRLHLIHEIALNSLIISQSQFGNYVIQYVLLHIPEAIPDVLNQLEGHYVELSMQKYSSNVVEKCIEYTGEEHHSRIIKELITSHKWDQIMQDPYGNYVIQAALNSSKGVVKAAIMGAIKPYVNILRTSPYGKKVLSSSCLKNIHWCSR